MWTKLLKTKVLRNPGPNQYLCSAHFPGGKKTYNNIPTIFPSSTNAANNQTKTFSAASTSNSQVNTECKEVDNEKQNLFEQHNLSEQNNLSDCVESKSADTNSSQNFQEQVQVLQEKHDAL